MLYLNCAKKDLIGAYNAFMQQISLIVGGRHRLHHIQLNPFKLAIWTLALLFVIFACSATVWHHYQQQMLTLQLQLAQHNPNQTHRRMTHLRDQAQQQLAVLAGRVGNIQAQIGRLNVLGERLTQHAQLDNGEFDFSKLPPMGGTVSEETPDVELDELLALIGQLERELPYRQQQLQALSSVIKIQDLAKEAYISGKPVNNPKHAWLSSPYGMRLDPFTKRPAMHRGIDFAGKNGTEITATGAGVVVFAGKRFGYGHMVEINHGNGLVTRYAHASDVLVHSGDIIKKGDVVALMGKSGRSTGTHVHYEVLKNNTAVNPAPYVLRTAKN